MTGRVLFLAGVLAILGGCSKDKEEPPKAAAAQPEVKTPAPPDLPPMPERDLSRKEDLERRADGLWYKDGAPFDGVAVTRLDSGEIEWEETFEKGARVGVKGWDEEGEPMELFSWDKDGEPLHQRPNPR